MCICARMIILPLSIVLHYCLTKTSDLTFIGCHNVQLQSCLMVMTTSVRAPLWHDDVRVCALACFVPYPLHKFILTSSFFYFCLWHISVLMSYHFLSTEYVCVRLLHFSSSLLRTKFLCLHVVSCSVSFCLRG